MLSILKTNTNQVESTQMHLAQVWPLQLGTNQFWYLNIFPFWKHGF